MTPIPPCSHAHAMPRVLCDAPQHASHVAAQRALGAALFRLPLPPIKRDASLGPLAARPLPSAAALDCREDGSAVRARLIRPLPEADDRAGSPPSAHPVGVAAAPSALSDGVPLAEGSGGGHTRPHTRRALGWPSFCGVGFEVDGAVGSPANPLPVAAVAAAGRFVRGDAVSAAADGARGCGGGTGAGVGANGVLGCGVVVGVPKVIGFSFGVGKAGGGDIGCAVGVVGRSATPKANAGEPGEALAPASRGVSQTGASASADGAAPAAWALAVVVVGRRAMPKAGLGALLPIGAPSSSPMAAFALPPQAHAAAVAFALAVAVGRRATPKGEPPAEASTRERGGSVVGLAVALESDAKGAPT